MVKPSILALMLVAFAASGPLLAGPLDDAKAALERSDDAVAFDLLKPLGDAGDADAQFALGTLFDLGRFVRKNPTEASRWYRLAATQGHAIAQHNLAHMLEESEGGSPSPYDRAAAATWYGRAAAQGYRPAQGNLGILHASGSGVRRDDVEAYKWLKLAGSTENLEHVARRMTAEQIAEGDRRAAEWQARPER